MTLLYKNPAVAGPATHAFVIGVGEYPFAKPRRGAKEELRVVRDLPSAADSAKLMCDWLLSNQHSLARPLGSIEVLISDPETAENRYAPYDPKIANTKIVAATDAAVRAAGKRWIKRLQARPGNVALFYACGHGANSGGQPVVFLSDLNEHPAADAWTHLNVGQAAQALRQMRGLESGFFFVDACGEFVKNFELAMAREQAAPQDSRFISVEFPSATDRDKVWVLCAASNGLLAHDAERQGEVQPPHDRKQDDLLEFEGHLDDAKLVRIGRFTQTLLKGLGGSSARWQRGRWSVDSMGLWRDFKMLQRLYFPAWKDRPFEPSQGLTPNEPFPIVHHAAPSLPVLVQTDPDTRIGHLDLGICLSNNGAQPWVRTRPQRDATAWFTEVPGDTDRPHYAVAVDPAKPACYLSSFFKLDAPQFESRVPIS